MLSNITCISCMPSQRHYRGIHFGREKDKTFQNVNEEKLCMTQQSKKMWKENVKMGQMWRWSSNVKWSIGVILKGKKKLKWMDSKIYIKN